MNNATFSKVIFLGIILSLVSVLSLAAQDFIIANGTGDIISEIEIRPSKKLYPKDKNVCVFQNLVLNDRGILNVELPSTMKEMTSFDVVLKYGKKTAKTKESLTIIRNGGTPTLVASVAGKPSSIPYAIVGAGGIAAGVGASAAATAISSGGMVIGASVVNFAATGAVVYGGPAVVATLTAIGGGSLATGVGVVVAVPVLLTAGALAAINLLSTDDLIIAQIL